MTPKSICGNIKNLVSNLAKKITLIVQTAKNLTPEEKTQIAVAMAKGAAGAAAVGGIIGLFAPGVGNVTCGAVGGIAGGIVAALITFNKIVRSHAAQLDAIAQSAAKEAAGAAANVEGNPIDNIKKSKLTLQTVIDGIKNFVSSLVDKIVSFIATTIGKALKLNPEETNQLTANIKARDPIAAIAIALKLKPKEVEQLTATINAGKAITTPIGEAIGSLIPVIGDDKGGIAGGIVGVAIATMIALYAIKKNHAAQLEAMAGEKPPTQAPEAEPNPALEIPPEAEPEIPPEAALEIQPETTTA
jgi:hypothetical protein